MVQGKGPFAGWSFRFPPPPWEKSPPFRATQSDKLDVIIDLVGEADRALKHGDYDSAFQRLVDAAGLLRHAVSYDAIGRERNPTGRGFYVGHAR